MATAAQRVAGSGSGLNWFWEFLKEELKPYPGRGILVGRIVVTATFMMILTLVFQIPYGAYGALFAVTISRENPETTINAARTNIIAFGISVLYILVGANLFLVDPEKRFLWVIGSFFLMFYALRVLSNYTAAARFGYLLSVTVPLWDEHISSGQRVENTLWAFGAIALGSIATVFGELIYAELKPQNDLAQSIEERLAAVEELLKCFSEGDCKDGKAQKTVMSMALMGTSRMRRFLQRSDNSPHYAEQMGAVISLVGRLVDVAANLTSVSLSETDEDRVQVRALTNKIVGIRTAFAEGRVPGALDAEPATYRIPILRELEETASLIPAVLTGAQSLSAFVPQAEGGHAPSRFFVPDAFTNPEHVKFALRGCLAASLCYVIYNGNDWAGISTSVTTCFLTALSTVGSSHQKQLLRFAGAIIGGLILGLGSQIFVLPYLDSITGFTLLFLAVTIPSVWIATSGPRLSYLGVQILVAFYLINLSEFKVQTSLTVARDRAIGIFLGFAVMWFAFDQLWASPAAVEMKRVFVNSFRLMAQFTREPVSQDTKVAVSRGFSLREQINKTFDTMRSLGDSVILEFGPSREHDLAWRSKIVQLSPQLRALFLTRISLWRYRIQLPNFQLPPAVSEALKEWDTQSANLLDRMADRLEGKDSVIPVDSAESFRRMQSAIESSRSAAPSTPLPELQTFSFLSGKAQDLERSLDQAIGADV
jgi:multidrug resistance protein MdtO